MSERRHLTRRQEEKNRPPQNGIEALARMVETGIWIPTFVAAAQAVTDTWVIPSDVYSDYEKNLLDQEFNGVDTARTRLTLRMVFETAGGASFKGACFKRAKTLRAMEKILNGARQGGRRILIYLANGEVAGLRPVSGGWRMVGIRLPIESDLVLSGQEIFEYLEQPQEIEGRTRWKGQNFCNIVTLNSEPKSRRIH